jgi:hypothetical protein
MDYTRRSYQGKAKSRQARVFPAEDPAAKYIINGIQCTTTHGGRPATTAMLTTSVH